MNRRQLLFVILLIIFGCAKPAAPQCGAHTNNALPDAEIFVADIGWHTGIVFPRSESLRKVIPEIDSLRPHEFYEFGWGDKDFYPAPDPGFFLGVKALFFSSGSVIHISGFDLRPEKFFDGAQVLSVKLTQPELAAVLNFIGRSFDRQGNVPAKSLEPGLYGDATFFPAKRRFSPSYTCNSWASEALDPLCCPGLFSHPILASNVFSALKKCVHDTETNNPE